MVIILQLKIH